MAQKIMIIVLPLTKFLLILLLEQENGICGKYKTSECRVLKIIQYVINKDCLIMFTHFIQKPSLIKIQVKENEISVTSSDAALFLLFSHYHT